ncbi:hypothetical protein JTB14_012838 [Gonioctena quinquepunctata]|nr:hypothetical protein JTB14_012838 [Gonioctena quinquepunctata]
MRNSELKSNSDLFWRGRRYSSLDEILVMAESNVITTRSLGTASEGIRDQYADGKAAKVWEIFIGDKNSRTQKYKNFLVGLLKRKGCKRILDVACGTG